MPVQQSTLLVAKTSVPRPALPLEQANPLLKSAADVSKPLVVKYQIISRDGAEIIVGRIKVPTPAGHAFILRRFDTGAISLTTMFRAAFPDASNDTEKAEANWVKSNYDTSGANGGGAKALRLAGTWVPVVLGLHLAPSYALTSILAPLATAVPESLQTYRSAAKSPTLHSATSPPPQLTPAPAATGPNKRRKESSPSPAPATLAVPSTTRTTRSKSRSPQPAPTPFRPSTKTPRTPATARVTRGSTTSPNAAEVASDAEPDVPGPSMEEDIAEQKELIANLKAARAAEAALANGAGPGMDVDAVSTPNRKRPHADTPPLAMNLDGPMSTQEEIEARPKVAKRRLNLEPKHKAVAWGALAFAVGMGATAFLPSLFF